MSTNKVEKKLTLKSKFSKNNLKSSKQRTMPSANLDKLT